MHVVMVREDFDTGDTELAIFIGPGYLMYPTGVKFDPFGLPPTLGRARIRAHPPNHLFPACQGESKL